MSADRYEISKGALDVLAITGPEGTRYIDGEDIEAKVIRQQARDLELLTQMLHDQRIVIDDLEHRRVKVCDENDQLRAERDEARTAYQVRSTEWHQHELIALALAERYKLRAEQAEARLAAIDGAPTVGWLRPYGRGLSTSEPSGERMPQYELIARPAKD